MNKKGQSYLELAITLPCLLVLFLGLIELGWAMHLRMELDHATREAARLASKKGMRDEIVLDWANEFIDHEIGVILTYVHSDPNHEPRIRTSGPMTRTSRLDVGAVHEELVQKTLAENRLRVEAGATPMDHDKVYVEMYMYHEQLLEAPVVEWFFPRKAVLYSVAVMRCYYDRS